MGPFQSLMSNKSLFSEQSYKGAIGDVNNNGYGSIIIKPSTARLGNTDADPYLIGLLTNKIQYSIEANWEALGGFAGLMPSLPFIKDLVAGGSQLVAAANSLAPIIGGAELGAVYSSRKVYHKSGYIRLSPTFRVVDWDGTGKPGKAALLATSYCVPFQILKDFDEVVDEFIKALKENNNIEGATVAKIIAEVKTMLITTGPQWAVSKIQSILAGSGAGSISQGLKSALGNAFDDIKADYLQLRSSPSPVEVKIGQYFYHSDMIIENVSVDFSKEMTRAGPLYVDISLTLSSRKIVGSITDLGFTTKQSAVGRLVIGSF